MESVEDVRQVVRWDSQTFVAHHEHGGLAIRTVRLLYRDADRPTFWTVFDGVGEKVGEDAMCACLVHWDHNTRGLGLEQKLVEVRHKLVFAHRLSRECNDLRRGQEQRQRPTRLLQTRVKQVLCHTPQRVAAAKM
jgi:hypothetical protein